MTAPLILCDQQEERSGIPRRLENRGCLVEIDTLAVGDYCVSAAVGIERKAPRDLVDSLLSGRLYNQLEDLSDRFEYAVLLIEGDSWEGDRRLKTPILARLYHWISFRPNITVLYSPSETWSARILHNLAMLEQSRSAGVPTVPVPVAVARTPHALVRSLPGVGDAAASRLLDAFGTPQAVFSASRSDLQAALGEKRGANAYDLLNSQPTHIA